MSTDGNLKKQPRQFWKYVASFRKINSISILLEVDGKHFSEPCDVAGEFSKHLQSVHNNLVLLSSSSFRHLNFCL
jgi:hypothetical protein